MTRILVDDKTKPNNSNVKVAQSLSRCGMNIRVWVSYVISAAIQKDCSEAFQGPLPGTRANAGALSLLTESTPADWGPDLVTFPSAYEALVWITQKFQGGHNREVNREWLRQLQTVKMDREQTLEQYLSAKWTLYSNLVGNNSTIDERDLHKAVVDCLPVELAGGSSGLYSQCVGKSRDEILAILRGHAFGLGFNDQIPRPAPKANHVRPDTPAAQSKSPRRSSRVRCWECGENGHVRAQCSKWTASNGPTAPAPSRPLQLVADRNSEPCVSLNVLQPLPGSPSSEDWIIDTGATVHVVNDITLLQNQTVFAEPLPLQLATAGSKGGIVATGSVCILTPEGRPLWLHNVQCVPDATANLFSVNASERDGIDLIPGQKGHYVGVSGPGDWECRVVREGGLFVLK